MGLPLSVPAISAAECALRDAVTYGSPCEVQQVLKGQPGWTSFAGKQDGNSLLHVAAAAGRADILSELLRVLSVTIRLGPAKGSGGTEQRVVNKRNKLGQTPLMLACQSGDQACVRMLLRAGGDPTLFDGLSHSTCLHYAAQYGSPEAIDALLGDDSCVTTENGGRRRVLLREALVPDSQGFCKYIDGRASWALTALHWAVSQGHAEAARTLIQYGAALTGRCSPFLERGPGHWVPGGTPLHLAAAKGDQDTVVLLLSAWAQQAQQSQFQEFDLRALRDGTGRRPVEVAVAAGHLALIPLLDPSTPLAQVVRRSTGIGPACLVDLAAAALLRQLSAQLDSIEAQQAQQEETVQQAEQDDPMPAQQAQQPQQPMVLVPARPVEACCPVCLESGYVAAPPSAASQRQAAARDGASEQLQWQLVAAAGCRHTVCLGCARELCRGAEEEEGFAVVTCPMCRSLVGGWLPIVHG